MYFLFTQINSNMIPDKTITKSNFERKKLLLLSSMFDEELDEHKYTPKNKKCYPKFVIYMTLRRYEPTINVNIN